MHTKLIAKMKELQAKFVGKVLTICAPHGDRVRYDALHCASTQCFAILNSQLWICVTDIFQESIILLAHPWLDMMAGNVVPVDTVVVEVVEQSQAVFGGTTLLQFTLIGLWQADAAIFGPIVLGAIGGWGQFLQFSCPEPSVDGCWLQVGAFTSFEVTDAT